MEVAPVEVSQSSTFSSDAHLPADHPDRNLPNHAGMQLNGDASPEDALGIIEVIAATGKFWHNWEMLKRLLSSRLKQVLAEYPESQLASGDALKQNSLFGETYSEMVERLDEALLSFTDGPPFTLQRLCEILLAPKCTYTSLSKLALALEKNLLVTSTLSICTEPYPASSSPHMPAAAADTGASADTVCEPRHAILAPDGVGNSSAGDGDEEMAEAQLAEDAMNVDVVVMQEDGKEASQADDSGGIAASLNTIGEASAAAGEASAAAGEACG